MPSANATLPPAALEHLSPTAKQNLPGPLQVQVADPGVYLEGGLYGAGPGWYHFGSSEDQFFLGHPNEADFYVFDFDLTSTGGVTSQGYDVATQFELALDGIVVIDNIATIGGGESYIVVARDGGGYGQLDDSIDYTLVRLRFDGSTAIETELARIGTFGFSELI
jgi:hypothetical protein